MRLIFAVAFSVLVSLSSAWAEAEKVNWSQGSVKIQGDHVVIEFVDGQRIELLNMRLAPDTGLFSFDKARLEMVTPSNYETTPEAYVEAMKPLPTGPKAEGKIPPQVATMFSMREAPTTGIALNGLKVVRHTFEGGRQILFWLLGEEVGIKDRRSSYKGSVGVTYLTHLAGDRHVIQSHLDVEDGMKMYPNEAALIRINKGVFALMTYDNWSGVVRRSILTIPDEVMGTRIQHQGYDANYPMPSTFERGKPFAAGGELFITTENGKGVVMVKSGTGETLVFGTDDSIAGEERKTPEWDARKLNTRPTWERGRPAIEQYFARQNIQKSGVTQLDAHFTSWFNGQGSSATRKPKTQAGTRRRIGESQTEVMFLSLSRALNEQFPQLRNEIALQLTQQAPTSRSVYYVRLPSNEQGRTSEVVQIIASQLTNRGVKEAIEPLIILDAMEYSTGGQSSQLSQVVNSLKTYMDNLRIKSKIAIIGRPDQTTLPEIEDVRERIDLAVDRYLVTHERTRLVQVGLDKKGVRIDAPTLEAILGRIERAGGMGTDTLTDLSATIKSLSTVLYHMKLTPESSEYVATAAKLFSQINGERMVGPFPPDVLKKLRLIPRQLSTSYPGHSDKALTGRDTILKMVESKLVSWMAYGHKESASLPLLFFGDNGTGKTMTAVGMADVLGAAVETLNMSALAKEHARFSYDDYFGRSSSEDKNGVRESDLRPIQDKIERLVLDPNPVKILVLDEIHTHPDIFNALLPALGNGDRKAPGVLNLDGIIVIMIANVDIGADAYRALSRMHPTDRQYPQQMFQLFKASLSGKDTKVDEKLAGALGGRLLPGMVFFPPLGMDREQQASLVDKVIAEYEERNKMRLVVQDAARKYLHEIAASYTDGNYRSVERAVRDELTGSFGRFIMNRPERMLEGYFVLSGGTAANGKGGALELLEIDGAGSGAAAVVKDSYDRFASGMQTAVGFAVETLKNGDANGTVVSNSPAELNRRNYETMLGAFEQATKLPLFKEMATGEFNFTLREMPLPGKLTPTQQSEIRKYIGSTGQELFTGFADYTQQALDLRQTDTLLGMASKMNRVLSAIVRLQRIEAESLAGGERPLAAWIEELRVHYLEALKASGGNVAVVVNPGSIEAMAVAAGYLTNEMAKKSADVLLSELRHDAQRRMLVSPRIGQADMMGANMTPECERILNGGRLSGNELDKILGN